MISFLALGVRGKIKCNDQSPKTYHFWALMDLYDSKKQGRRTNQLEKQILTPAQITYLLGKKYEAEKHSWGSSDGFRRKRHLSFEANDSIRTSERIAAEYGVGAATVRRAEHYAKGIDAAEAACPGMKQALLSGSSRLTKQKVIALSKLDIEEVAGKLLEYAGIQATHKEDQKALPHREPIKAENDMGFSCIMVLWK